MSGQPGRQFLIDAQWTDAAVTLGHTPGGVNAGPGNTLTDRRGEFYRTAVPQNTAFINYDLGQIRPISSFAVVDIHSTPTVEAHLRVFAATSEAELSIPLKRTILFDGNIPLSVDSSRHMIFLVDPAQSFRFIRVELIDFTSPNQLIGWSRVMFGGEYRPSPGVLIGSGLSTPGSASQVTETEAGSQFVRHLFTRRTASISLNVDEDQYLGRLWELLAFTGSNRPIAYAQDFNLFPGVTSDNKLISQQMIYGRFPNPSGLKAVSPFRASITLDIEEWT